MAVTIRGSQTYESGSGGYNASHTMTDLDVTGTDSCAIAAGFNHSLALTRDGCIFGWGSADYGQLNFPFGKNFVAISAGTHHSLALTVDGTVVRWGHKIKYPKEKIALPYDFLTRLNQNLKTLCKMPKYIKMEILEDYTGWDFRDLYNI